MFDNILPLVKRPIRYTGGEYNITVKPEQHVRVGIVFPEIYEIGMSNLGIKIIYHLFNKVDGIQCERIFAPWVDFGEKLKAERVVLYGLETKKPVRDCDLLGFSLQSELCYTTVLYMLELADIPFACDSRDARHPILIAGGPVVLNPTPLSRVFDAFVVGDGEEPVGRIAEILKGIPREQKEERIAELSKINGVWVPRLHGSDTVICRSVTQSLDDTTLAMPPIVPICAITHDRFAIEVMRGCSWGCRFCQAGYVNRPVRIRPEQGIINAVEKGIRQTGWEEISLLSFSILDYPDLLNLLRKLNEILRQKRINISLPAMRGELFTEDLAVLLKEIKKTGLTFAPETASESLRCSLNKSFSNDRLISSINTAHRHGWKQVKLYFMLGLPFEQDKDIDEINVLLGHILKAYPKGGVKLSVSSFIPKPHTPFEAVEFAPVNELQTKISRIRNMKRRRVEVKYQSPEVSYIEAVLSKADQKIFPVIEEVYKQGGVFEEWREHFEYSRWNRAFNEIGIDPQRYLKTDREFPWDFINVGVTKEFLKREYTHARDGVVTANCFYDSCADCGACNGSIEKPSKENEKYVSYGRYPRRKGRPIGIRVKYSVGEPYRYASHLDITRTIYRALRRSDLPIQFTQGFSPIPKVSFCPPKSVGQTVKGDFFDFFLESEYFGNISMELNARFPSGIRVLDVRAIPAQAPSLSSSINLIHYEVNVPSIAIKKMPELSGEKPTYVQTKSGMKSITEGIESLSFNEEVLSCGLYFGEKKINVYELLSHLTERSVEECKLYKVSRTTLFIKKNGILYSPMEVK